MIDTPGRAWELQKLGIVEGMKSWNALKSELLNLLGNLGFWEKIPGIPGCFLWLHICFNLNFNLIFPKFKSGFASLEFRIFLY